MNIPESIVSRVSFNKFGELFIQFKVKKEDQSQEMRDHFMSLWESGNSLALATAPFQVEERESIPEDTKTRNKNAYERLRWEVVKDRAEDQKEKLWTDYKWIVGCKKRAIDYNGEILHAKDIWTPEEAEAEILKFQGRF